MYSGMNTTQLLERIRFCVSSVNTIHKNIYVYMSIWHCLLNGIFIQSSRFLFLFRHEPIAQYTHLKKERTHTHTQTDKKISIYTYIKGSFRFLLSVLCAVLFVILCVRACMCFRVHTNCVRYNCIVSRAYG